MENFTFPFFRIFSILVFSFLFYYLIKTISQTFFQKVVKNLAVKLAAKEDEKKRLKTILHVVNRATIILIVIIAALMIIAELGINIAPLLAGAGILGITISFGAQTLIKDMINGLFIVLEGQFSRGDLIKIGDIEGQVADFNLRRTLLRDNQNILYYVPNSEIKIIANKSRK
ncbi:MAG: mechanosensitive ion channel domain-containing protein [bacterium]